LILTRVEKKPKMNKVGKHQHHKHKVNPGYLAGMLNNNKASPLAAKLQNAAHVALILNRVFISTKYTDAD